MSKINKNIPKSFKLFSTTITTEINEQRTDDQRAYGLAEYGQSKIILSTMDGIKPLSKDKIMDTFYHEKVHIILDSMHERELSKNEKFVDIFAKLLRQSDETAEY